MSEEVVLARVPSARTGHVAVAYEHYMFVWGGYQNNIHSERYLPPDELCVYDSYLDSWQIKKLEPEEDTSVNCPPGTSGASVILKGGAIYLFGGYCFAGNTNELYRLNLQELRWEYIPCNSFKPSPRDKLTMWDYGNSIYIFGGFGPPPEGYLKDNGIWIPDDNSSHRGWNNQLLVFDLLTQTWTNPQCGGQPPSPRAAHASARIGNKVYLFGGRHCSQRLNDLHCLNLDTMTWTGSLNISGSIPVGRSWHTLNAVSSNELFLYGGFTQDNVTLSDGWILNVDKLEWQQLTCLKNEPRLWHSTCVSNQNDVLVFGGCCNNILSEEEASQLTNSLLIFRFTPKSLFRLSIDATFKHRTLLHCEWTSLPKPILELLEAKVSAKDDNMQSCESHKKHQGQTVCVLS